MSKMTFKEFAQAYDEPLNEEDARRLKALKDRVERGDKGAEKLLHDLIDGLSDRDKVKADIRSVLQSYGPWKQKQKDQDRKFSTAKSEVEARDDPEKGSAAWRKETGSIRRPPKGSAGTRGTIGPSGTV